MPQDERGYLILPHELATGADCDGCLIVLERGDMVEIKCNSCGAVVDTVPIERAGTRLMELASVEICSAECPHCGAGWPFTVKNAAALEPMFTRHLQEHYRISAQRAKEKTESTNGDG